MMIFQVLFLILSCLLWQDINASYIPISEPLSVEYAPHVVGHTLHSIPTAVSHQSQTIVHDSRPYLHSVVSHSPIVHKAHYAPIPAVSYSPYAYSRLGYENHHHHDDWTPKYSSYSLGYGPWGK